MVQANHKGLVCMVQEKRRFRVQGLGASLGGKRDWYFIAEQPAPAPHLARPEGRAALHIVLVTFPRVSRSCEGDKTLNHEPSGLSERYPTFDQRSGTRWNINACVGR